MKIDPTLMDDLKTTFGSFQKHALELAKDDDGRGLFVCPQCYRVRSAIVTQSENPRRFAELFGRFHEMACPVGQPLLEAWSLAVEARVEANRENKAGLSA